MEAEFEPAFVFYTSNHSSPRAHDKFVMLVSLKVVWTLNIKRVDDKVYLQNL
jgi:hypothetical protein